MDSLVQKFKNIVVGDKEEEEKQQNQENNKKQEEEEEENQEEEREITLKELKKHTKQTNLWFVIKGVVYDMTKFYHPGGKKVLLQFAGKDGTEGFLQQHQNPEYMNHFQDFKVGVIKLKPGEKLK